jgi:hypothetical protein
MNSAQFQADVLENTSQDRFVDVPLDGAGDDDLPVCHALLSEKRKLLGPRGTRVRKQSFRERHSALNVGPCLSDLGRQLNSSPFGVWLEEQDLVEPDAFIAKQVGRMRTADHLSSSSPLHCRKQPRKVADYIGVQ